MKIHFGLDATEAAAIAHALVMLGGGGKLLAKAVRKVEAVLAIEDKRTALLGVLLEGLQDANGSDWEIDSAESDDGEEMPCALAGEINLELEELLATRASAKRYGNILLDVVALLRSLELTDVRVKKGGRWSSLDEVSDAIVRLAGEHSVFLTPARERCVGDDLDEEDEEDEIEEEDEEDDEDLDDDEDEDLDQEDLDDDGDERVDADGIPPGGWGASTHRPRYPALSAEEIFFLEISQLSWPATPDAVRAAIRRVAHYHPDTVPQDPILHAVRTEQFARLTQGQTALLARLGAEAR
jgi:hypothetical protein